MAAQLGPGAHAEEDHGEIAGRCVEQGGHQVLMPELKHFPGIICCESYPGVQQFNRDRASLEENFRIYSEMAECFGTAPR